MSRHKTLLTFAATVALGLFISPVMAQQATPPQPTPPLMSGMGGMSGMNGMSGMGGMSGQATTTSPPASLSIPVAPAPQVAPASPQVTPATPDSSATPPTGMMPSGNAVPNDAMSPATGQPSTAPTLPANGATNPEASSPATPENGATSQPAPPQSMAPQDGMAPATPDTTQGAPSATPGTDGDASGQGAQPAPSEDPYAADTQGEQDEMSIDDIPDVTMIALTPDVAKHAIDLSLLISEKYKDVQPENYASWQELVDKDPQGKAFEADVKAAGFNAADEVSDALTTVSIVYTYVTDPQTQDFKQQIEAVKNDPDLTPEMRDKIVAKLTMYIPSDDNIKVIRELMADPAYLEKLKQLEADGE